jgi:hypothetical protein
VIFVIVLIASLSMCILHNKIIDIDSYFAPSLNSTTVSHRPRKPIAIGYEAHDENLKMDPSAYLGSQLARHISAARPDFLYFGTVQGVTYHVTKRTILISIYTIIIDVDYMIYQDEKDQPVTKYRVTYEPQFLEDIHTEGAGYDSEEIELHDVVAGITRLRDHEDKKKKLGTKTREI